MARQERAKVVFSGRVQGVGFRFTTHEIAQRYQVIGWVKNLSDGRVEVVAAGTPFQVDEFLRDITERSRLARLIDRFDKFEIDQGLFEDVQHFSIIRQ